MQYLNLIRYVMDHGVLRTDRTNTGTRSVFGTQMRFSLADGVIPVLTTKKVFWRGVVEELLWFIHGSTDGRILKVCFYFDNESRIRRYVFGKVMEVVSILTQLV